MADVEQLHFKIGISGTFWDKRPVYTVVLNDQTVVDQQSVALASDEVEYIEFDQEITEGSNVLKIRLENKDRSDTVQNEDKTAIVKDMLLNIVSIEIDEINLGQLIWDASSFTSDDADRPTLKNCVNLGWNGTWQLEFTSPFYIWLLENI